FAALVFPLFPYTTLFRSHISFKKTHFSPRPRSRLKARPVRRSGAICLRFCRSTREIGSEYFLPLRTISTSRVCPSVVNTAVESRSEEHTSELQSRENLVC